MRVLKFSEVAGEYDNIFNRWGDLSEFHADKTAGAVTDLETVLIGERKKIKVYAIAGEATEENNFFDDLVKESAEVGANLDIVKISQFQPLLNITLIGFVKEL
jgi:hypothetical protein